MKAAVLERVGKISVKEVPEPSPKTDQVLVKVAACGLCGTDVKLYKGEYSGKIPVILGHEFAGEIVEVGGDVLNLKVGDRVVSDPNEPCRACDWCRSARSTFCETMAAYGVLQDGGFAGYCVVGEKGAYRVPEGLGYTSAAFAEPVACALHAIDRAAIRVGETVVIIGGGPMGQILLQLAKSAGANKLIMVTRSAWKLELAAGFGATDTVSATEDDVHGKILDLTRGMGADVVIEAVGAPRTIELGITLAKKSGRVIIFGFAPQDAKASFIPFDVLSRELSILGAWVNPYTFPRALDVLASEQVDVASLVSRELDLESIMDGFALMEEKPQGFMKGMVLP